MNAINLLPVFVVGLAGSVHCVGMCGGIVGALTAAGAKPGTPARARPQQRIIPIAAIPISAVATAAGSAGDVAAAAPRAHAGAALRVLAYNAGRIGSYMAAGALAGGLAGGAASLARIGYAQTAGYWAANLMLIALGLYLMGAWRGLDRLEALGGALWRRVQPLLQPLLPMDSAARALALGGLWGWVPCAMVYSVLLTAMLSGSAAGGAAVMLAFGLGTLPMLLALGLLGARLRRLLQQGPARIACGLLVLGFGVLGLLRAAGVAQGAEMHGWLGVLCLTVQP